jgi:hypothetical protein
MASHRAKRGRPSRSWSLKVDRLFFLRASRATSRFAFNEAAVVIFVRICVVEREKEVLMGRNVRTGNESDMTVVI